VLGSGAQPEQHEAAGDDAGRGDGLRLVRMGTLTRTEIQRLVGGQNFGERLCQRGGKRARIFDFVAGIARGHNKDTDVDSIHWRLHGGQWLQKRVNLVPRRERRSFQCSADVYSYRGLPPHTLVVDFANRRVGGGCFGNGFVQEEQMVAQSSDFAARLLKKRDILGPSDAIAYRGVHMDVWWPRSAAAKKDMLQQAEVVDCHAGPLTILAVDAPRMVARGRGAPSYNWSTLGMLARKVMLIYEVAEQLGSPHVLSGLLGCGAFRNNRPLVLLLHLLFQPSDQERLLHFHHPIFWSFCDLSTDALEQGILDRADDYMEQLQRRNVTTVEEALHVLLEWQLPLSEGDSDLQLRRKVHP
jgi:hypothetical protein